MRMVKRTPHSGYALNVLAQAKLTKMPMRVGVFVGEGISAEEGGGNTLRAGIVNALKTLSTRHKFILFYPSGNDHPAAEAPISLVQRMRRSVSSYSVLEPIARFIGRQIRRVWAAISFDGDRSPRPAISFEEQSVRDFAIDVAWFLTPRGEPVSVPYIASVWDLEHRKQPYFPEVSTTGWCWEDRERNYRRLLPRAARVVTGTSTGKKEIVSFYGVNPDNVHVVPNPVDNDFHNVSADKIVNGRRKCGN